MTLRALTPLEARVLAVLVEKHHTVPDTYPLSLNALVAGCNQKTARTPVMEASESDVIVALDGLKQLHLVVEVSGSRVSRYEHNAPRGLGVPSQSVALLTTLMLRGPQTAAELRLNSERLHKFADVSSVEAFLDELSSKEPARVVKLPRAPGAREARWAHLLCGEPAPELLAVSSGATATGESVSAGELSVLKAEVARLSGEMQALRAEVLALQQALGISPSTEA
ncbi:YceH family protein [Ideonella paludis]|uniref:YceH family protein n=1 Tax=Ideonella paludis TaxID=1233411 RepID=A0ABS5E110_9BURK|nr:YceH family protein [Ideonella paludis]MBQ0937107.1 YceH family protein [Ideonella paludis]